MTGRAWLLVSAMWGVSVGCDRPAATVVFAAASTSSVAQDVARQVERETGREVVVNVGATSTLARQIARGAPADVFLAADPAWVDWLETRGVPVRQRQAVAGGRLVVVGPVGSGHAPDARRALRGRVALADPSHVPAGRYARRSLVAEGLWAEVEAHVVVVGDVRAALAAVEVGAADRAVVYASDAARSRRAEVVWRLPPSPAVRFEAARLDTDRGDEAYLALLRPGVWASAGFDPAP